MIKFLFRIFRKSRPVVPVIRLQGVIAASSGMRRGLSMAGMATVIDRAFEQKGAKAVALLINSPGGSPVQSALIFDRIRHLSKTKDVPVISFVEDVAASGGYWLACAGDEIIVNPASVVGSIGVVSAGFGFDQAIEKIGVSRRVYTSGARKGMLDPFSPESPDDVSHLKSLQADIDLVTETAFKGSAKLTFTISKTETDRLGARPERTGEQVSIFPCQLAAATALDHLDELLMDISLQ